MKKTKEIKLYMLRSVYHGVEVLKTDDVAGLRYTSRYGFEGMSRDEFDSHSIMCYGGFKMTTGIKLPLGKLFEVSLKFKEVKRK